MRDDIKQFLKNWLPSGLLRLISLKKGVMWSGDYDSWTEAQKVSTGYDSNSKDKVVDKFINQFKLKFSKEPGLVSALGYDCANLIISGIMTNGNSSDGIRNYLLQTKDIQGAAGNMNFDNSGDVHKPIILKYIENGTIMELKNDN